jgi:hypothetical protein
MTARNLTMVWIFAAATFAAGCGHDCVALCEEGNACEGAAKIDCAANCENYESLAEPASCEDQLDDLLTCQENQDDVCKEGEQCRSKALDLDDCLRGYCINLQADKGINPVGDDQTDPACKALAM